MRTPSQKNVAPLLIAVAVVISMIAAPAIRCTAQNTPSFDANTPFLDATYDAMTTAFDNGQIDRIPTYLTDDYTETDPHGQVMNQAAALRKLRDMRSQIQTIQSQWSIQSVTSTPDGLMVQMKMHSAGKGSKRFAFFKITGTFTNDMVVRDCWVDTADGWRIKSRVKLIDDSHIQAG